MAWVLRTFVSLTLVLILALISGCSSPSPSEPASLSSQSPEQTEITPPVAQAPNEPADQFIRRWLREEVIFQRTGLSERLLRMQHRCAPCLSFIEEVERTMNDGGEIHFAGYSKVAVKPTGVQPAHQSEHPFLVSGRVARTRYRKSARAPWMVVKGGGFRLLMTLSLSSEGTWTLANKERVAG